MSASFEDMLTGGHHNSLGRTEEVVALTLSDPSRLDELLACYESPDEVVRLRTSSALKRLQKARHEMIVPLLDHLIHKVGCLDQASAQWTLAQLFAALAQDMTADQRIAATSLMERNLAGSTDWIVLIQTMKTLTDWAQADQALAKRLRPKIDTLTNDPRKSVSKNAAKCRAML